MEVESSTDETNWIVIGQVVIMTSERLFVRTWLIMTSGKLSPVQEAI